MPARSALLLCALLSLIGCPGAVDDDVEGNSPEDCNDLLDNDGDVQIDCRDPDCAIYTWCQDDDDSADDDDATGDDDDTAPNDDDTAPDDDDTTPDDDDTTPDDDDTSPDDDDATGDDDDATGDDDDATGDDDDTTPDDDDTTPDDDDTTSDDDDTADDDDATTFDVDGDGFTPGDGDCDDDDPAIWPGAPEFCDGVDSDCDPTTGAGVELRAEELGGGALSSVELVASFGGGVRADEDVSLTGLEVFLDTAGGDTLVWSVYWSLSDVGPWTAMWTDTTSGTSTVAQWHSAPPMNLSLQAGVRYLYTVSPAQPASTVYGTSTGFLPWGDHLGGVLQGGTIASGDLFTAGLEQPWSHLDVTMEALDHDLDGDGFADCVDCDDYDAAAFEGNPEVCDGQDNDCDFALAPDEDVDEDADGDPLCDDCDDTDPTRGPSQPEACDGEDTDCDGAVPADEADGDGDGAPLCADCDDGDGSTYPGALEVCDGIDNNCNGLIWPGETDVDGDGVTECDGDCDALDPSIFPGAVEACDAADTDCDGDLPPTEEDGDGDGYAECNGECDDTDPAVHPNTPEACNGVDDNCDGVVPPDEDDGDGDGARSCEDCDDADPARSPWAVDVVCDGIDNDCDGLEPVPQDVDLDGADECTDCDDNDDDRFPGNPEVCDGGDNDCDPATTENGDADNDFFTLCDGDCDDADASVVPDPSNNPPLAQGGGDQSQGVSVACEVDPYGVTLCPATCGLLSFTLDASATADVEGDPIEYSWAVVDDGGAAVSILGSSSPTPTVFVEQAAPEDLNGIEVVEVELLFTAADCVGNTTDPVVLTVSCSSLP